MGTEETLEVRALVERERLGRPIQLYRTRNHNWFNWIFMAVVGIVLAPFGIGLWLLWELYKWPNINKRVARQRVYLHEFGFVHADGTGVLEPYRWDRITTVHQSIVTVYANGIKTPTKYLYTVARADGKVLKLNQIYAGIAELGTLINQQVSQVQLPQIEAALARGEYVPFTDLNVARDGVTSKRGTLAWSQIERVRVVNGWVSIIPKGKRMPYWKGQASKLPNFPILLDLLMSRVPGGIR